MVTEEDVLIVLDLAHWTGGLRRNHHCKCAECRAIKQVCAAARERIAQSASKVGKSREKL